MRPYTISGGVLTIGGIDIQIDGPGAYERYLSDDNVLYMLKGAHQIAAFATLARRSGAPRVMVEVGVSRGGSTIFFNELFDDPRMVCIERHPVPIPLLSGYHATRSNIDLHYGVDQADRRTVLAAAEKLNGTIDWVVDDASHLYEPSRATFETLFPLLRNNALYIVEDWSWSHMKDSQTPDHYWSSQSALTNLIFDLVIACGTRTDIFAEFHLEASFFWLRRGSGVLPTDGSFRLDNYMLTRGRHVERI